MRELDESEMKWWTVYGVVEFCVAVIGGKCQPILLPSLINTE